MEFNGFIVRNLKNECQLMFLLQFLFFSAFNNNNNWGVRF